MPSSYELEKGLTKKYGVTQSEKVKKQESSQSKGKSYEMESELLGKYTSDVATQRRAAVADWKRRYNSITKEASGQGATIDEDAANSLIQDFDQIKEYADRMGAPNAQRYLRNLETMVQKQQARKATSSGLLAEDAETLRKQRETYQAELDAYLASDEYKEKEQRSIALADIASFNSGITIQPIEDSKGKDLREKIADIDVQLNNYDRIDGFQASRIDPLKEKDGFSTARADYNSTAAQKASGNSQVSQRMAENQQAKDTKVSTLKAQRDAAQAELDAWVASEEYQHNLYMLAGNKDLKYSAAERKKKRLQNKIADLDAQITRQEQEELPGASQAEQELLTEQLDALTRNRTPDEYEQDPDYQATLAAYAQAETEEDNLGSYLNWYEALSDQDKEKLLNGNYNPQAVENRDFVRSQPGDTGKHWERMTEDEINAYYYIANTEGMAAAKEFLEELQTTLDWRHTTARETATQEQMSESGLVGNMLRGVATTAGQVIAGPMAFASDVVNALQGKDFNPYSNAHYLQNIIGVTRSAAANDVQTAVAGDGSSPFWNAMGEVAANAYQAGLSTLDSLMGMGAMGSTYTAGMGMGAAASRMRELYESGATDKEIYLGAIGSGILEAMFEKVSLEYFTEDFIKANPEKWIKKMLLQSGVEGSEEVFTEISNMILDAANRGVNSDHERRVRELMGNAENPMSREEAERKAVLEDAMDVLWAGFGGMVSGGLSSVGGAVMDSSRQNQIGQDILNRNVQDTILAEAQELRQGDTTAIDLGQKQQVGTLGKNTGLLKGLKDSRDATRLGRLMEQNVADMTGRDMDAVRSAVETRLKEEKSNMRNPEATAEAIVKNLAGEELSVTDRFYLAINEKYADKVRSEIYSAADKSTADNAWVRNIGTYKFAPGVFGQRESNAEKAGREAMETTVKEEFGSYSDMVMEMYRPTQSRTDFVAEAKTLYQAGMDGVALEDAPKTKTLTDFQRKAVWDMGQGKSSYDYENNQGYATIKGETTPVNIVGVAASGNGKLTLRTDDGGTVEASNVTFGSYSQSKLYSVIAAMNLDTNTANQMVTMSNETGLDLNTFARAMQDAFFAGRNGIPFSDIRDDRMAMKLTREQRELAWKAGRAAARERAVQKGKRVQQGKHGKAGGGVKLEASARSITNLNAQQEAGMNAAKVLSALGLDITVYASTEEQRAGGMENGNIRLSDGSIRIDLNAGDSGEGTMAWALSHEFTHFVEELSPEKFQTFQELLFDQLGQNQQDVMELIEGKVAELSGQEHYSGLNEERLWEIATSEVVAEMMEPMLTDTDAIAQISDQLRRQDKGLWQKVKDWITGLVEKLKKAYRDLTPGSAIARQTREVVTQSEEILNAWVDVASDAIVNYTLQDGQKNNTPDGVRYSTRSLSDQIDDIANQTFDTKNHVYYGTTPRALSNILSIPIMPMLGTYTHAYTMALDEQQAANEGRKTKGLNFHGLGWDTVKSLTEMLNHPVAVIKSNTDVNDSRFVVVTNAVDGAGNPIIAALTPKGTGNYYDLDITSTVLLSGYGKNNFQNYLTKAKSENRILWVNKKNHQKQASPGVQFPNALLSGDYTSNLAQFKRIVKNEFAGTVFQNTFDENGDRLFSSRNPITQEQNREMEDHFGTTSNYDVAGYILTDGKMLDFSGRHWGDTSSDYRQVDHRDIWEVWEHDDRDGLQEMVSLIAGGGIRLSPESGGINLSAMPNQQQISTLRGYINHFRGDVAVDIDSPDGKTIQSFTYGRGVSSSKVISDLKAYFESGAVPESQESVRDFLYSQRSAAQKAYASDSERFVEELSRWERTGQEQGQRFVLGSTGEILQGLGAIESDIYINGDKINTILQEHPEITMQEIKQIPQILNDPTLILKSRNAGRTGQNTRMTLFGSVKGTNGQPVMAVFDLRPMENHIVINDMQKVTSAYTKTTDAVQFVKNSYVMYADKKRATSLLRSIGFQMPIELLQSGFTGSITYRQRSVNLYGEKFTDVFAEGTDTLYSERGRMDDMESWELNNYLERGELEEQVKQLKVTRAEKNKEIKKLKKEKAVLTRENNAAFRTVKEMRRLALENYRKQQTASDQEQQKLYDQQYRMIMDEYQSQLEKAERSGKTSEKVKGWQKTEERGKLQRTLGTLNKMILNPTKSAYVPDSLQPAVIHAMEAFNDYRSSDQVDMARIRNLRAELDALIAKGNDPEGVRKLNRELGKLQLDHASVQEALTELKQMYARLIDANDGVVAQIYDEGVEGFIADALEAVGKTDYSNLSVKQLQALNDAYSAILYRIRTANNTFAYGKKEAISDLAHRVGTDFRKLPDRKKLTGEEVTMLEKFGWNNLKPVYAFQRLGSQTMATLYNNLRNGEDVFYNDIVDARAYALGVMNKYGYQNWQDKVMEFESVDGKKFSLSLEERMSLYAYSRREQALEHLTMGGIVLNENTKRVVKNKLGIKTVKVFHDYNNYRLSLDTIQAIGGSLTAQQKAFAEEMQQYLSTVCAEKNNEISRALYGVSKAKEKYYWPLKVSDLFSERVRNQIQNPGNRQKNAGHMKATTPHANNPVVVSGFMDTWGNHVNNTAMYHAFTLPMEDFLRVYNFNNTDGVTDESIIQLITQKHGKGATDYIDQFLKDLNQGVRADPRESIASSLTSKFKKGAVSASLSVAIQQPSAVGRAFAVIDPKYFSMADLRYYVTSTAKQKTAEQRWEHVKKYAPVAGIKELGRFDVNMGRSTVDFITGAGETGFMAKVDEISGYLPEKMDQATWMMIYNAAERQCKAKGYTGEELNAAAGALFTEAITKTQVYDSVFSRSGNMRSKSLYMNMATSFMAEPTTTVNMFLDAYSDAKQGNWKAAGRKWGSIATATVLNAILASFIYAARDDDEDSPYREKLLKSFTSEMVDSFNPMGYVPIAKDIWSLFQGYDIDRSDMTLWSEAANTMNRLKSACEAMDELDEEDADYEEKLTAAQKKVAEAWGNAAGAICNLTGLPVKNVLREVRAIVNTWETVGDDRASDWDTTKYAMWEAFQENLPEIIRDEDNKSEELYKSMLSGSEVWVNRMKAGYSSDEKFQSAVKDALRDQDSRIREAAKALGEDSSAKYKEIVETIFKEGHFSETQIEEAIQAEARVLTGELTDYSTKTIGKFIDLYEDDLLTAQQFTDFYEYKNAEDDSGKKLHGKADIIVYINDMKVNATAKDTLYLNFTNYTQDDLEAMPWNSGSYTVWEAEVEHPDIAEYGDTAVQRFIEVESSEITESLFADFWEVKSAKDENGKYVYHQDEVLAYIDSLPISNKSKDELYLAAGWKETLLYKAPWNR